ncbi:MAG: two-component system regulatory protein YycI [Bacillota bacterium]
MDWARAKNILILIFLLLNVFLAFILLDILSEDNISSEIISNARAALSDRGVIVNCEIPLYNKQIGVLTYNNTYFNKSSIIKNIFGEYIELKDAPNEKQIIIENKRLLFKDDGFSFVYEDDKPEDNIGKISGYEELMGYVNKLLLGSEIPVLNYQLDSVYESALDGQKTYKFIQKYRGFWVYENHITVSISDSGTFYLKCRYRPVDRIIQSKKIMPAYQVLLKNHKVIKNVVIDKIDMGFKEHKMSDGTREIDDVPVWRVRLKDLQEKHYERYFRVYDGEEIE